MIRKGALGASVAIVAATLWRELRPLFWHLDNAGILDWDFQAVVRGLTPLSLLEFGELPLWHPWLAGGFTNWGHIEGATNLVSPFLPLYLWLPLGVALRWEIVACTVIGSVGVYVLASRLTRQPALCALAVVLGFLNGRWTMQMGAGHAWHLQYAWLPWVLWCFDRALDGDRRAALYAGALMALMVYVGAIYPLPQTALLLALYSLIAAAARRQWQPLRTLAVSGAVAIGLAAPKLVSIAAMMSETPRHIASREALSPLTALQLFVNPDQGVWRGPVEVPDWGFYEYGIYTGWLGAVVLVLGMVLWSKHAPWKEQALRALGVLFFFCGLGEWGPRPWHLLHELPVFKSQHVPSRFLFPATLLLALAFVAWCERSRFAKQPLMSLILLLPLGFIALDISGVARELANQTFSVRLPPIERASSYEHRTHGLQYSDTSFGRYPSMLANFDVVDTYDLGFVDPGADAADAPGYRGMAFIAEGAGSARIERWTPNSVAIAVEGASPGARVVYNMNFDRGWRADDGREVSSWERKIAFVASGDERVTLRYRPRGIVLGLVIGLVALAACARAWWRA